MADPRETPAPSADRVDTADAARRVLLADYLRRVGGRIASQASEPPAATTSAGVTDAAPSAAAATPLEPKSNAVRRRPADHAAAGPAVAGESARRLSTSSAAVVGLAPPSSADAMTDAPGRADSESDADRQAQAPTLAVHSGDGRPAATSAVVDGPPSVRPPAAALRSVVMKEVAVPPPGPAVQALGLSPRLTQTLAGLLAGRSEKQIALGLSISPHTVHEYVKQLHKRFGVSSRGELLAHFIGQG